MPTVEPMIVAHHRRARSAAELALPAGDRGRGARGGGEVSSSSSPPRIANRPHARGATGGRWGSSWPGAQARGLALEAGLAAARGSLHPDPPRVGADMVKQHLAAIRACSATGSSSSQVLPGEPGGGRAGAEARCHQGRDAGALAGRRPARLLDADRHGARSSGLRDRALLSVLVYSFARVSAAVGMRRQDYFRQGLRGWLWLHEKGGRRHDVPAHHRAEQAVAAYVNAAGLDDPKAPLFQERRPGRPAERPAAGAPGRPGDDQAPGGGGGAAGVDLLPHVSGDGDHGVSVERGDARARAADRRARVAEDDEALRPDGRCDQCRRDRTHRDLEQEK